MTINILTSKIGYGQLFSFSFQVMLDTGGPELQVVNKSENPISLQADSLVVLTPDQDKEATSNLLPINFSGLSKVNFTEAKETKYVLFWKFIGTAPPRFPLALHALQYI